MRMRTMDGRVQQKRMTKNFQRSGEGGRSEGGGMYETFFPTQPRSRPTETVVHPIPPVTSDCHMRAARAINRNYAK